MVIGRYPYSPHCHRQRVRRSGISWAPLSFLSAAASQRGQTFESNLIFMVDCGNLAMHQLFGVDDPATEGLADGLMSKADAK